MSSKGHQVTLGAPGYGRELAAHDPDILRVPAGFLPFDPEGRVMSTRPLRELGAALAERSFDILHIQTPFVAHYLADDLGLPRVESCQTFFEEYLFQYLPLVPEAWMRYLAPR